MITKKCLLVLVVMGLTFLFTPTADPASKDEIESLRGLIGINVEVEDLNNDIKRELSFDEKQIRVDVELKLRMAGIKVLSEEERIKTPGRPYLYINLNIDQIGNIPMFHFNIRTALEQGVHLVRNPNIFMSCSTWETNAIGTVGKDQASEIRDKIKDILDVFINDYLSVNP